MDCLAIKVAPTQCRLDRTIGVHTTSILLRIFLCIYLPTYVCLYIISSHNPTALIYSRLLLFRVGTDIIPIVAPRHQLKIITNNIYCMICKTVENMTLVLFLLARLHQIISCGCLCFCACKLAKSCDSPA